MKHIKQILCNHQYKLYKIINATFKPFNSEKYEPVPIHLYECTKCGKRKISKCDDYFYKKILLNELKMWKKGEIEL